MASMTHLYAVLPVTDVEASLGWYTALFGRPADEVVGEETMWRVDEAAGRLASGEPVQVKVRGTDELARLVDAGTIRIIDILILVKDADGSVEAMELSDIENLGPLQQIEAQLAELLAEEDVVNLAAAMDPGSTAGVLIWENLWAAPFAAAARRSGGQLIADGRIPIQAIIAAIDADDDEATEGD